MRKIRKKSELTIENIYGYSKQLAECQVKKSFPEFGFDGWRDDAVQEGIITGWTAFKNIDMTKKLNEILGYISKRVRGAVIDFIRCNIVPVTRDGIKKPSFYFLSHRYSETSESYLELVSSKSFASEDENIAALISDDYFHHFIRNFSRRTSLIFNKYFKQGMTLREIAIDLDLSESRVFQILQGLIQYYRESLNEGSLYV